MAFHELTAEHLDDIIERWRTAPPHVVNQAAQAFGLPAIGQIPALPAEEYANKLAAEASLYEFVRQAWHILEPDTEYVDGWHIRAICNHLEAVADGRIPNLLINIPPGHMKSLCTCVFLPAWIWIQRPSFRMMFASYSPKLSVRDSVICRQLIQSRWYQQRWGANFRLLGDQNEKVKYENDQRGWRQATSVGGGATGEHPDLIVIDDPLKALDAHSEAVKREVIDWWTGTLTTRGAVKNSRRIVIMQRLAQDDLAGHILDHDAGQGDWDHICLPMRWEPDRMRPTRLGWMDPRQTEGELLWDPPFDETKVRRLERALTSLGAAGQLQQRPVRKGGNMFRREWFELVDAGPAEVVARVRYFDKAGTEGGGKYSAGVRMSLTVDGLIYVEDVQRRQLEPFGRNKWIRQIGQLDAASTQNEIEVWVEQEPGSSGKFDAMTTVRELVGITTRIDKVTGSKEARLRPLAAYAEVGNVRIVRGAWNADWLDELEAFPNGQYKDQADASGGAFNALTRSLDLTDDQPLLASTAEDMEPFTAEERAELPDFWRDLTEPGSQSADEGW